MSKQKDQSYSHRTIIALAVILCVSLSIELWAAAHFTFSDDQKTTELSPLFTLLQKIEAFISDANRELFAEYDEPASQRLASMTLEEKVGQLFLVRFPDDGVIQLIKQSQPGGLLLFGKDFQNETKASIQAKLQACQKASDIPLILAVDEEGGSVVRVSAYPAFRTTPFSAPREIVKNGRLSALLADSTEKSQLLKSIGLNMNLTPVADIADDPNAFMYDRSFNQDAETTADYVASLIHRMNADGMIAVMKHFPGYGNNADTHTDSAIDHRSYEQFQQSDFLPFRRGIAAKAPCILVSHMIVPCMDPDNPASLSKEVHRILREDLHFTGIIMTDDLAMGAVKNDAYPSAAVQAVLAGNDLIISSDFRIEKQAVIDAVNQGVISEARIDQAVKRILAWKYSYHIIPE